MPLYKTACDACGCDDPNCGLVLAPKCHPSAGTHVKFFKTSRTLDICCTKCDALVARLSELGGPPS